MQVAFKQSLLPVFVIRVTSFIFSVLFLFLFGSSICVSKICWNRACRFLGVDVHSAILSDTSFVILVVFVLFLGIVCMLRLPFLDVEAARKDAAPVQMIPLDGEVYREYIFWEQITPALY